MLDRFGTVYCVTRPRLNELVPVLSGGDMTRLYPATSLPCARYAESHTSEIVFRVETLNPSTSKFDGGSGAGGVGGPGVGRRAIKLVGGNVGESS